MYVQACWLSCAAKSAMAAIWCLHVRTDCTRQAELVDDKRRNSQKMEASSTRLRTQGVCAFLFSSNRNIYIYNIYIYIYIWRSIFPWSTTNPIEGRANEPWGSGFNHTPKSKLVLTGKQSESHPALLCIYIYIYIYLVANWSWFWRLDYASCELVVVVVDVIPIVVIVGIMLSCFPICCCCVSLNVDSYLWFLLLS